MSKRPETMPAIVVRIASLMQQMGIEGLPRNYELVYEVFSGVNPELKREFLALGKTKTQNALDEIGRKHLPHHHEESVLAKATESMQGQVSEFMELIAEEKSSLVDFGRAIDEASKSFSADGEIDREKITRSIRRLSEVTQQQASRSEKLASRAETQSTALNELKNEMDHLEQIKNTDKTTGLANRRAFNKAVMQVYAKKDLPEIYGLAFADIDHFKRIKQAWGPAFANSLIAFVAKRIESVNASDDLVAHFDDGRFAILMQTGDESEIARFVEMLQGAVKTGLLKSPEAAGKKEAVTLSLGIAMSQKAQSPAELVGFAEKALAVSVKEGGNRATFHSESDFFKPLKDWLIYRK